MIQRLGCFENAKKTPSVGFFSPVKQNDDNWKCSESVISEVALDVRYFTSKAMMG